MLCAILAYEYQNKHYSYFYYIQCTELEVCKVLIKFKLKAILWSGSVFERLNKADN